MDNGDECKYSCKTASEPLEWIHAIVNFLKPYRFFLNAHVVNFFKDSFLASFALGWLITNGAGLASFPIDTIRRRMMMTSGKAAMYKSSMDAFTQILKNEGSKSLFKGAGANILLAVAGHGVLVGYNKLQVLVFRKKYGSGGA